MVRALFLAGALTLAGFGIANAQGTAAPPAEIGVIANQFLSDLKAGKSSDGFHFAFKDIESLMGTTTIDNISAQTGALLKTFGDIQKWSPFKTDVIANTFIRRTYYVECKSAPLFVTIQFYNGGRAGTWSISSSTPTPMRNRLDIWTTSIPRKLNELARSA
jgi:hypothetical protein